MSLVMPLTRGQKPFEGIGSGLKKILPALGAKSLAQFAPVLMGVGAALIGYNFMTGTASLQNSMVGIAALLLSLRALSGRAGFLRNFLGTLMPQKAAKRNLNTGAVNRIIAGTAAGFAIGVPLSAVRLTGAGYILGIPAVLAGIILYIIAGRAKEAES
jgi:phage shock protein PspC (stress-responsive transcriptional regulator)